MTDPVRWLPEDDLEIPRRQLPTWRRVPDDPARRTTGDPMPEEALR